ncbi:MAG TPA: transposase [Streptosporangiaceae bacterium]|nr:transposase [Streptosporangiaceae bacterium]
MAKSYRPVDRDQPFLFPPDMREWLPADHPVWLVITVVDGHLDTSAFHARRKTGGAGTAGYDPDMLATVLVRAYAHGVTSSREIERLCGTDVAFRVICAGNTPDHVTFARFRGDFPEAVAAFFTEVLVLCARLGMGKLGTVALDGMKIAASASKAANRTEEGLRKLAAGAVAAHAAADAAEDELFGAGRRGDEVPEEAWSPQRRGERIRRALADLEAERKAAEQAEQAKAEAFRERQRSGQRTGCSPDSAAVELAEENLARVRAARAARLAELEQRYAAGQPRRGRAARPDAAGVDDHCRVRQAQARLEAAKARAAGAERKATERAAARKGPGPVRNITDPDSRLMPVRGGGFIQGYNAQNMTSEDELIIATELTDDPVDCRWFEPMLGQAQDAAALIEAHRPAGGAGPDPASQDHGGSSGIGIGLALADAGYCSEANLTCPGPDRLIAVGKHRDLEKAARGQDGAGADRGGPAIQAMRERLKTDDGITAYRHRGHIAETPHGHIKHNMGIRQLSMRGKPKASAEWKFICAVHNLFKALTTGHLTSQALAALAS